MIGLRSQVLEKWYICCCAGNSEDSGHEEHNTSRLSSSACAGSMISVIITAMNENPVARDRGVMDRCGSGDCMCVFPSKGHLIASVQAVFSGLPADCRKHHVVYSR